MFIPICVGAIIGFAIGWAIMDLYREYTSYAKLYNIELKNDAYKSIRIDSLENQLKRCQQNK